MLGKKRFMALLMACAVAVTSLAGCGSSNGSSGTEDQSGTQENAEGSSDGTVVMARSIDSETLDPALASKNQDIWMMNFALEGLVRSTEDGKDVEPAVADTWEISDDYLTYTFHIRDGIKFSNGEEVTPEDCVYSINRAKNMEGGPYTSMISAITDIRAEGEDSVVVTVEQPTPYLLSLLAMFPCRRRDRKRSGGNRSVRPGKLGEEQWHGICKK